MQDILIEDCAKEDKNSLPDSSSKFSPPLENGDTTTVAVEDSYSNVASVNIGYCTNLFSLMSKTIHFYFIFSLDD